MAFKRGMPVDLCMAFFAHARFDNLDFDARSQWQGRGEKRALNDLDNLSKQYICSVTACFT